MIVLSALWKKSSPLWDTRRAGFQLRTASRRQRLPTRPPHRRNRSYVDVRRRVYGLSPWLPDILALPPHEPRRQIILPADVGQSPLAAFEQIRQPRVVEAH